MICGGVAMSSGLFWWTRMVERRWFRLESGENGAVVGGLGSELGAALDPEEGAGAADIWSSQGRS